MNNTTFKRIVSPYQINKGKVIEHPAEKEIKDSLGEITLTASFSEDKHTLDMLKEVPGLVAFLCVLKKGSQILSEGRSLAVISGRTNRWIQKSVSICKNQSLLDAVSKSTRILEALQPDNRPKENAIIDEAYQTFDQNDELKPSEKQISYFKYLVTTLVEDESEREQWLGSIPQMNRSDMAEAISEFAHR